MWKWISNHWEGMGVGMSERLAGSGGLMSESKDSGRKWILGSIL